MMMMARNKKINNQPTMVVCWVDAANNGEASTMGVKREGEDSGGGGSATLTSWKPGGGHDDDDDAKITTISGGCGGDLRGERRGR
jgi:hypothetical protein